MCFLFECRGHLADPVPVVVHGARQYGHAVKVARGAVLPARDQCLHVLVCHHVHVRAHAVRLQQAVYYFPRARTARALPSARARRHADLYLETSVVYHLDFHAQALCFCAVAHCVLGALRVFVAHSTAFLRVNHVKRGFLAHPRHDVFDIAVAGKQLVHVVRLESLFELLQDLRCICVDLYFIATPLYRAAKQVPPVADSVAKPPPCTLVARGRASVVGSGLFIQKIGLVVCIARAHAKCVQRGHRHGKSVFAAEPCAPERACAKRCVAEVVRETHKTLLVGDPRHVAREAPAIGRRRRVDEGLPVWRPLPRGGPVWHARAPLLVWCGVQLWEQPVATRERAEHPAFAILAVVIQRVEHVLAAECGDGRGAGVCARRRKEHARVGHAACLVCTQRLL